MRKWFLIALALFVVASARAEISPEGLWVSFDDDGKTPTALVRITKINGRLNGRIEKILDSQTNVDSKCGKCIDDRKNLPLVGLEIIRGTNATPQSGEWRSGKILDPEDGEDYRLVMSLQDDGEILQVKGYWGLFWRTQYWKRVKH